MTSPPPIPPPPMSPPPMSPPPPAPTTAPAPTHPPPSWPRSTIILMRLFGRMIARPGRLIAMIAFAVVVGAVGLLLGRESVTEASGSSEIAIDELLGFASPVLMGFAIPVLALFTSAGGLAEMISDKTLVYVWLRPLHRSSIAFAAWFDAMLIALLVALPLSLTTVFGFIDGSPDTSGRAGDLIAATVAATVLATAAYVAFFVLLNALTRFGTLIGATYVLIWELVLAPIAPVIRRLSIGQYAISFIGNRSPDLASNVAESVYTPDWVAATVLIATTMVGVALTAVRLARMNVD